MDDFQLSEYLKQIPSGDVRAFICSNVPELESAFEHSAASLFGGFKFRIAEYHWNILPELNTILDDIIKALAQTALALFPRWYGMEKESYCILDPSSAAIPSRQHISVLWFKAAALCCQSGNIPIPDGFPKAIHASQLALIIEPDDLFIALGTDDTRPKENRLLGLAKAAQWIAKETQARVGVLIPKPLSDSRELDSILYGAFHLDDVTAAAKPPDEEAKRFILPLHGKPHPFSPGEKKLAQCLSKDYELAALFEFNQIVTTVRQNRYLVDLLWEQGKLVVEVDGYQHHSNRHAFRSDRHRDYELMISGYSVLRLTHEEIMEDVELAKEKIRDVVKLKLNR